MTLAEIESLIPFLKPFFEGMGAVRDFFSRPSKSSAAPRAYTENGGHGGIGGSGTIEGNEGLIIGGRGGRSGRPDCGSGGDGGSGSIKGDGGIIIGGDGGEAAQFGRPGLGAQSPLDRLGLGDIRLPDGSRLGDFGRGGNGGAPPISHDGRLFKLADLIAKVPKDLIYEIDAERPLSPQDWWDRFATRRPAVAAACLRDVPPLG